MEPVRKGYLQKKSGLNVTWAQRFCVLTLKEFRYYYFEKDYRQKREDPLGCIPLKDIYQVEINQLSEVDSKDYVFQIKTSNWLKKQMVNLFIKDTRNAKFQVFSQKRRGLGGVDHLPRVRQS